MMLPDQRPPIEPPRPSAPLPVGRLSPATEPNPPHADYNHQPLLVSGLEHYVKPEEEERFHVS